MGSNVRNRRGERGDCFDRNLNGPQHLRTRGARQKVAARRLARWRMELRAMLRALLPVLEGTVADELVRDFKQVTSNLQLAYADAAK